MSTNIRVHVSGHMDYAIDNPAALIDASTFTPEQFDNLRSMDPEVWKQLSVAFAMEFSKRLRQPDPPGHEVS
mgnify:CR=1 FL=1